MLQRPRPHWAKYYPFTLDRVTRNTLCSGAAALLGGGSCLLLGERRKVRRGPGSPFKGCPGRSCRSETPLAGGVDRREERKGGALRHPPLRSLFRPPTPAINGHKKPALPLQGGRISVIMAEGKRYWQYRLRVNTLRSQLYLPTVGLLYPFCGVKSRLRPP